MSKMFFAMDRIKYKRLWPRDIADMYDLRTNHPNTWRDLEAGNISVTKNEIPFVSIGADQKSSKVSLMWELARSQSTMTLDQVQSRGSMAQSTKLGLRS